MTTTIQIGSATITVAGDGFQIPEVNLIPQVVSMRQARLALLGAGQLAAVANAIHGIQDEQQKQAAQIEWEYATEVRRDHWLINGLAPALGMTQADLDNLFVSAAAL